MRPLRPKRQAFINHEALPLDIRVQSWGYSVRGNKDHKVLRQEKPQHVLILASGENVRHMVLRPWMAFAGLGLAALITTGYIGSAAYLFFRDDLFNATLARQARMQSDYEKRISALRIQVDNLTSQQYRDQQLVEHSVARLLDKQKELAEREEQIGAVLLKADSLQSASLDPGEEIDPVVTHSFAPVQKSSLGVSDPFERILTSPSRPLGEATGSPNPTRAKGLADKAEVILDHVDESLKTIEQSQKKRIADIASDATRKADALGKALASTGLRPANDDSGMGGPYFEPIAHHLPFEQHLDHLDQSLSEFNRLKATAEALPLGLPAASSKPITSRFGNRIDPFLGRLALHAGVDFAARTGDDVFSTGSGKIVFAGTSGGYGKMVEVEHENGYSTRYGHLSQISVRFGDQINIGDVVGKAGSTGRSTGPHVHYEVRHKERALDPMRFIAAGKKITTLIQ